MGVSSHFAPVEMNTVLERPVLFAAKLITVTIALVALYVGRDLLMPLALASLFAFLLHPLVAFLCHRGLPRPLSVVLVTLVVFSILSFVMFLIGREAHNLANDLPNHRQTIQKRIDSIGSVGEGGIFGRLREMASSFERHAAVQNGSGESGDRPSGPGIGVSNGANPDANLSNGNPSPVPAEPASGPSILTKAVNVIIMTLADSLATAGLVILFVIFLLLRQQDISQRILKLIGFHRLTITAKAIDEVTHRVSRYLLAQAAINGTYGVCLGIGLAIIGVPYVLLFGVLAALFRFIPYIGPWVVAILPAGLSLAIFDGWTEPIAVICLILVLELVTNMVIEPLLYGQSAGVSDFALVVAIAFWTFLWGGIGLILATPLTVCFVVFCKYIPALEWVEILMGEHSEPQPRMNFYQKMLLKDEGGLVNLIRESEEEVGHIRTLDEIVLPALQLARNEFVLGRLENTEFSHLTGMIRSAVQLLETEGDQKRGGRGVSFLGKALDGEADLLAIEMFSQALLHEGEMEIAPESQLIGEIAQDLSNHSETIFCISAMPPGAELAASVLCRRIRLQLPNQKILVCRWGLTGSAVDSKVLLESGANWVVESLAEIESLIAELADSEK